MGYSVIQFQHMGQPNKTTQERRPDDVTEKEVQAYAQTWGYEQPLTLSQIAEIRDNIIRTEQLELSLPSGPDERLTALFQSFGPPTGTTSN
jgi:hypothetical protein